MKSQENNIDTKKSMIQSILQLQNYVNASLLIDYYCVWLLF